MSNSFIAHFRSYITPFINRCNLIFFFSQTILTAWPNWKLPLFKNWFKLFFARRRYLHNYTLNFCFHLSLIWSFKQWSGNQCLTFETNDLMELWWLQMSTLCICTISLCLLTWNFHMAQISIWNCRTKMFIDISNTVEIIHKTNGVFPRLASHSCSR